MCGVIGYQPRIDQTIDEQREAKTAFGALFQESTIRGQHYYGIAQPGNPQPDGYSGGFSVYRSQYRSNIPDHFIPSKPAVAHTRFSQSGDWRVPENNQPLIVGTRALVMNGVIHMGTKSEFEKAFGVKCAVDNDAEIFLRYLEKEDNNSSEDSFDPLLGNDAYLMKYLKKEDNDSSEDSFDPLLFINNITGSFAGVWLDNYDDGSLLYAARNPRRPLWRSTQYGAVWVASTLDIFLRAGFERAWALPAEKIHCEPPYFNTQVDALLVEKLND
jgi:glucosamine 6-phosphate synthetase-like amidotransferase/phosphosugar isomerase protein